MWSTYRAAAIPPANYPPRSEGEEEEEDAHFSSDKRGESGAESFSGPFDV